MLYLRRLSWTFAVLPFLCGCGGGGADMAPVTGTVTYDGKPVTGGTLVFTPTQSAQGTGTPGRPATASVGEGGKYTAVTDDRSGVIVGKHRVNYTPPSPKIPEEGLKPGQPMPKTPYDGLVVKTPEVEVKSDTKQLDIELVKQ